MAATYNVSADQGATFLLTVTWTQADGVTPVNVTGYTGHMQVRSAAGALDLEVDASSANGMITMGGTAGTISVNVPSSIMSTIAPTNYKYDLEVFSSDPTPIVTRLIQGSFKVTAAVTVAD